MNKYVLLFCLFLSACATRNEYYPFHGTRTMAGTGGYFKETIMASDINRGLLLARTEYKYDQVDFYALGLPDGQTCRLVGLAENSSMKKLARTAMENDANVATYTPVTLKPYFDEGRSWMESKASGGMYKYTDPLTDFSSSFYAFNLFECMPE